MRSALTLCVLGLGLAVSTLSQSCPASDECPATPASSPHIVFILADDLGWNDVSFHGSDQIPTPNIDSLAYHGVILNNHYTQTTCTPSRAALLTGKYPIHTGLHYPLSLADRTALNISEKLLPQYLKELGYSTHIVGKWHLGFYEKKYTPLQRGFDTHFGYWSGFTTYYSHITSTLTPISPLMKEPFRGHDLRRDYEEAWQLTGQYMTELLSKEAVTLIENHPGDRPMFLYLSHLAPHAPLEAPQQEIDKFSHIQDLDRRTYAAMVSKLDQSVGAVIAALDRKRMLDNTIVVFLSDNGAPVLGLHQNQGSNYPWRGQKMSLWEGAVRTPALVWSPLIKNMSTVNHNLMHITDWFSTLRSAAGYKSSSVAVDGVDQWGALVEGRPSARRQLLVEINFQNNMAAIVRDNFKYIKGPLTQKDRNHTSPSYSEFLNFHYTSSPGAPEYEVDQLTASPAWRALHKYSREPVENKVTTLREAAKVRCQHDLARVPDCQSTPCMFDLETDPCEQHNVADLHPATLRQMEDLVQAYKNSACADIPLVKDPASDPKLYNNTLAMWLENRS